MMASPAALLAGGSAMRGSAAHRRRRMSGMWASLLAAVLLGNPEGASSGNSHYLPPGFVGLFKPQLQLRPRLLLEVTASQPARARLLRQAQVRPAITQVRMVRMADGMEEGPREIADEKKIELPVLERPSRAFCALRSSRRSALGVGIVGMISLAPIAGREPLAAGLAPGLQQMWPLRIKRPSSQAETSEARTQKAVKEAKTVDAELRKELLQIKKDLELDSKALQKDLEARLNSIEKQLLEGNGEGVLPVPEADVRVLDRTLREQAKAPKSILDSRIAQIDRAISDLDTEAEKEKCVQEFAKKKKELAGQLRSVANKVDDADLKNKMFFEADLLERESGTQALSLQEQLAKAKYTIEGKLEDLVEPLLVNNTEKLLKLENSVPLLRGKLLTKQIKDDAEYLTFPLLGGMVVQKKKLNVVQVAVGGVMAGAAGELLKDLISFPIDTIRTRLMTVGSFIEPKREEGAAKRETRDEAAKRETREEGEPSSLREESSVEASHAQPGTVTFTSSNTSLTSLTSPAWRQGEPQSTRSSSTARSSSTGGVQAVGKDDPQAHPQAHPQDGGLEEDEELERAARMSAASQEDGKTSETETEREKREGKTLASISALGAWLGSSGERERERERERGGTRQEALSARRQEKAAALTGAAGAALRGTAAAGGVSRSGEGGFDVAEAVSPGSRVEMQDVKRMWGPRGRFRQAVARMSSSITDATDTLLGRRNGPVLLFGEDFRAGTQTLLAASQVRARRWSSRRMAETARGIRTRLERDPKWRELALRYKETRTVVRKMTRPLRDVVAPLLARVPIPAGLFKGVYRGITPVILASPFQGALFFGTKDTIKKALPMLGANPTVTFIISVIVSDAAYWIVRCPVETIKTRVQTGVDDNLVQSIAKVLQSEGWYGFYRGYIPLLQLDFPFTAVNFALFSTYQNLVPVLFNHQPVLLDQFVGGFICSAITAGITCPLSVATTRILLDAGGGAKNDEKIKIDVDPALLVKELETQVMSIEKELERKVADNVEKTRQAAESLQKEVGTAIMAATSLPRTFPSSTTTLDRTAPPPPPPPPPPPASTPLGLIVNTTLGPYNSRKWLATGAAAEAASAGEASASKQSSAGTPTPTPTTESDEDLRNNGRQLTMMYTGDDMSSEKTEKIKVAAVQNARSDDVGGRILTVMYSGEEEDDRRVPPLPPPAVQLNKQARSAGLGNGAGRGRGGGGEAVGGEGGGADSKKEEGKKETRYINMVQTIKKIATEEGIGALFKGLVPRVIQLGLNHAIRFTGYQSSRNLVVEGIFAQDGMTTDQNLFRNIWGAVFGAIFSAFIANSN